MEIMRKNNIQVALPPTPSPSPSPPMDSQPHSQLAICGPSVQAPGMHPYRHLTSSEFALHLPPVFQSPVPQQQPWPPGFPQQPWPTVFPQQPWPPVVQQQPWPPMQAVPGLHPMGSRPPTSPGLMFLPLGAHAAIQPPQLHAYGTLYL